MPIAYDYTKVRRDEGSAEDLEANSKLLVYAD